MERRLTDKYASKMETTWRQISWRAIWAAAMLIWKWRQDKQLEAFPFSRTPLKSPALKLTHGYLYILAFHSSRAIKCRHIKNMKLCVQMLKRRFLSSHILTERHAVNHIILIKHVYFLERRLVANRWAKLWKAP